jgi:hypothetical protein
MLRVFFEMPATDVITRKGAERWYINFARACGATGKAQIGNSQNFKHIQQTANALYKENKFASFAPRNEYIEDVHYNAELYGHNHDVLPDSMSEENKMYTFQLLEKATQEQFQRVYRLMQYRNRFQHPSQRQKRPTTQDWQYLNRVVGSRGYNKKVGLYNDGNLTSWHKFLRAYGEKKENNAVLKSSPRRELGNWTREAKKVYDILKRYNEGKYVEADERIIINDPIYENIFLNIDENNTMLERATKFDDFKLCGPQISSERDNGDMDDDDDFPGRDNGDMDNDGDDRLANEGKNGEGKNGEGGDGDYYFPGGPPDGNDDDVGGDGVGDEEENNANNEEIRNADNEEIFNAEKKTEENKDEQLELLEYDGPSSAEQRNQKYFLSRLPSARSRSPSPPNSNRRRARSPDRQSVPQEIEGQEEFPLILLAPEAQEANFLPPPEDDQLLLLGLLPENDDDAQQQRSHRSHVLPSGRLRSLSRQPRDGSRSPVIEREVRQIEEKKEVQEEVQREDLLLLHPNAEKFEIKTSNIPNAGLGLFANKSLRQGEVTTFNGNQVPYFSVLSLLLTTFTTKLDSYLYMDTRTFPPKFYDGTPRGNLDYERAAAYANEPISKKGDNASFYFKGAKFSLILKRDVAVGEEIYVCYGGTYARTYASKCGGVPRYGTRHTNYQRLEKFYQFVHQSTDTYSRLQALDLDHNDERWLAYCLAIYVADEKLDALGNETSIKQQLQILFKYSQKTLATRTIRRLMSIITQLYTEFLKQVSPLGRLKRAVTTTTKLEPKKHKPQGGKGSENGRLAAFYQNMSERTSNENKFVRYLSRAQEPFFETSFEQPWKKNKYGILAVYE